MTTSSDRQGFRKGVQDNAYEGYLLKKKDQPDWKTPTLLTRFANAGGIEVCFMLTGDAREQFKSLEENRIYNMSIKGSCVKNNTQGIKYGVVGPHEIRLQHKCRLSLAQRAWPLKLNMHLKPFGDLNQCADGEFVDFVGRLRRKAAAEPCGPNEMLKAVFSLTDGTYDQDLELLGDLVGIHASVGDILLVKGAAVKAWKDRRHIQTGYLTYVQVNPVEIGDDIPTLDDIADQPVRKAMRLSPKSPISIQALKSLCGKMEQDEKHGHQVQDCEVHVFAQFSSMSPTAFDADVPTIGELPQTKYLYRTEMFDTSGSLDVKLWDGAGQDIFGITANRFTEEWLKAIDVTEAQQSFIASANEKLAKKYLVSASVKLFKGKPDINVNHVELQE